MAVWRLQTNTDRCNIFDYCIKNNVAAMGWSLHDIPNMDRMSIRSFDDYCKLAETQYTRKSLGSVYRLNREVKKGDLIWIRSRDAGKYYIARVTQDSKWRFNDEAEPWDASNQLTNIYWYAATENADEDSVPGAVATAFIKGSTFQRINKPGIEAYSQLLWNQVHNQGRDSFNCSDPDLSLNERDFFDLLQPEDLEDLLAMWLYDRKGYICIPSTNKVATPRYECVMLDPNDAKGRHIYIQVKKGKINLDTDEYADLNGEVYLLTTGGKVANIDRNENVKVVSASEIFSFACNPNKINLIPESVQYWIKFLSEIKARKWNGYKGIIFDTNRACADSYEEEMLSEKKIAAYGEAARYIDRFNKGDYALFYSKGRGVVAIGRIISDCSSIDGEEKSHKVEMIVPKCVNDDMKELPALTPREIKEILGRDFFWASTIKTPYISGEQVRLLIEELESKHSKFIKGVKDENG